MEAAAAAELCRRVTQGARGCVLLRAAVDWSPTSTKVRDAAG